MRTTIDIARFVPFSLFVLIPFMELLLPVFIKFFPNMLPSTFQEAHKKEENMKKRLKLRIEMTGFFQDVMSAKGKEKNSDELIYDEETEEDDKKNKKKKGKKE